MHIERKIIIVLSILLLVAVASIALMMANSKTSSSVDSTVIIKNTSVNESVVQEPTNTIIYNTTPETKNSQFQLIAKGSNGGDVERGNYILTKSVEWKDLWTKINYYSSPIPPAPEVNFSKEMVIALFAGRKYTSGYSIEVSDINETSNGIIVFVKEDSPGENCIKSQVLTYPFYIVKIPRTTKDIGFNTEEIVVNC